LRTPSGYGYIPNGLTETWLEENTKMTIPNWLVSIGLIGRSIHIYDADRDRDQGKHDHARVRIRGSGDGRERAG